MTDLTPISGWPLVLIVSLICLKVVRWIFGRWQNDKFQTNTIGKLLELSIIAGAANQLSGVPIVAAGVTAMRNLIAALANAIGPGYATALAVVISLVATIWFATLYWKSDNEWWTVLFALAVLVLSAAMPDLARYLGFAWILVVTFWNIIFAAMTWLGNPFGNPV